MLEMFLEAIYHRPKGNFAYAYDQETIHLRLRTKRGDIDACEVLFADKYAWEETQATAAMARQYSDAVFDYWQVAVQPPYRRLCYAFRLRAGTEEVWLTEDGFRTEQPVGAAHLFEYPYLNRVDVFVPPAWVKDAVFYQIFPERFANGDPSNDPADVQPWGAEPTGDNFFGGDLQGVIDHLDHLQALGVNALYFTPVFTATTNHKYDTVDYMCVDPHFGDIAKLKELVRCCHERGMRVMLDAVFNHSGYHFAPFQDVVRNGRASKYWDWFYVHGERVVTAPRPNFETFAFTGLMPKLNTENEEVKQYFLDVAQFWIEEVDIDGWRLDVANEVDHAFWREFRQVVKRMKPDAYILGEVWHDAGPWLQGDQFDAVMNYPFTEGVLGFFCRETIDAKALVEHLHMIRFRYPEQVNDVLFNLLDSHDTARLLRQCGEDRRRMKLAALFQLTYTGAPCIYYGDEVGMTGGEDPDCRRTMVWDEQAQDGELFAFYKTCIGLRRKYRALRSGDYAFVYAAGRQLAIRRAAEGETFLILLNAADEPFTFSLSGVDIATWEDAFSPRVVTCADGTLNVSLPPYGFSCLRQRR